MKLTKRQTDELFNCHEGVGMLAVKTRDNEISIVEFWTDRNGEIRYLTDDIHSPKLDLNEYVKREA